MSTLTYAPATTEGDATLILDGEALTPDEPVTLYARDIASLANAAFLQGVRARVVDHGRRAWSGRVRKTVERDGSGQITAVLEEPW